jgi:hypothetical protein
MNRMQTAGEDTYLQMKLYCHLLTRTADFDSTGREGILWRKHSGSVRSVSLCHHKTRTFNTPVLQLNTFLTGIYQQTATWRCKVNINPLAPGLKAWSEMRPTGTYIRAA